MSPLFNQPRAGQERNALASRLAELAEQSRQLSLELRDFRDEYCFDIHPDDYDYITELGVEVASYATMLLKAPAEQIVWLERVLTLGRATLHRLKDEIDEQGGAS